MAQVAERQDTLSPIFDAFRRDPAFGTGAMGSIRIAAFDRFIKQGFPTTRQEEWRHTNVAPIAQIAFDRAPVAQALHFAAGKRDSAFKLIENLVIVPGLAIRRNCAVVGSLRVIFRFLRPRSTRLKHRGSTYFRQRLPAAP